MRAARYALVLTAALGLAGCYHTRLETGLRESSTVLEESFALGFIYGIIPPATVETAEDCPYGVAVVESQMSVVNGVVYVLTLGIVTPMEIRVTCAAAGEQLLDDSSALPAGAEEVVIAEDAAVPAVQGAFAEAADRAVASGAPVVVRFE